MQHRPNGPTVSIISDKLLGRWPDTATICFGSMFPGPCPGLEKRLPPRGENWSCQNCIGANRGVEMGEINNAPLSVQPPESQTTTKRSLSFGVVFVIVNAVVLMCVIVQKFCGDWAAGYLLVFGFPTSLYLMVSPDIFQQHKTVFLVFFIVNYAIVSYLFGWAFSWAWRTWFSRTCSK